MISTDLVSKYESDFQIEDLKGVHIVVEYINSNLHIRGVVDDD